MIKLLNAGSGSSSSGSFPFQINALSGENRLLFAAVAMWGGTQPTSSALFNSTAGTLLMFSTTATAYLAFYYWLDDKIPPPGTYSYAGTSNADAAAALMLLGGVDQRNPFGSPKWVFNSSSAKPTTGPQMRDAVVAALATLGSNTTTQDQPLGGMTAFAYNNAKINMAWSAQKLSAPGFTTSGDGRTTVGSVAIKAYEYSKIPLARLLSRRVSPAMRWWMGA